MKENAAALVSKLGQRWRFSKAALAGLTLCVLLVGATVAWHQRLRTEDRALEAQLIAAEKRWASVSSQLRQAEEARPRLRLLLDRQERIIAERAASGWAPVLRNVVTAAPAEIELREIRARVKPQSPGFGELQIGGLVGADAQRRSVDQFRLSLEAIFGKGLLANAVLTEFTPVKIDTAANDARSASAKAVFSIVAGVALDKRVVRKPVNF